MKQEGAHYIAGKSFEGKGFFEMVLSDEKKPMVTLDPNGFKNMQQAHIYKLSEDFGKAYLMKSNQPADMDSPPVVELTPRQSDEIRKVVESGKFI